VLVASALIASPWYLRNLALYGNLSGMVESANGVGFRQAIAAAGVLPWGDSLAYMSRAAVWTGNNSFVTFSRGTIDALLFILGLGGIAYFRGAWQRGIRREDGCMLLAAGAFGAGILYITAVSYSFTRGASAGASPWYLQPLVLIALILFYRGCDSLGRVGQVLLMVQLLLCGYIACMGYVGKLIPLYSGYHEGRSTVVLLLNWYLHDDRRDDLLRVTALGPVEGIYVGIAAIVVLCAVMLGRFWRCVIGARGDR
jgi:hypothetical protein